jgi:hypothetical protein
VEFGNLENSECPAFSEYDLLYLPFGTFITDPEAQEPEHYDEFTKRLRQLQTFMDFPNKIVCFLFQPLQVRKVEPYAGVELGPLSHLDFAVRILKEKGIKLTSSKADLVHLRVKRQLFSKYISKYGVARIVFEVPEPPDVIAQTEAGGIVGFSLSGRVISLPCHFAGNGQESVHEFFRTLTEAIQSFKEKLCSEVPAWMADFKLGPERILRGQVETLIKQRETLEKEISEIDGKLTEYDRYKLALVDSDEELLEIVMEIFSKGLGIKTERLPEFKDNFWLLDDQADRRMLVELRGLTADIDRAAVSQANLNRDRNGLKEDFPAFIIVNTFMESTDLKERDQPIPAEIVEYAEKLNFRVMRVLDLLKILDEALTKSPGMPGTDMLTSLLNSHGWVPGLMEQNI